MKFNPWHFLFTSMDLPENFLYKTLRNVVDYEIKYDIKNIDNCSKYIDNVSILGLLIKILYLFSSNRKLPSKFIFASTYFLSSAKFL